MNSKRNLSDDKNENNQKKRIRGSNYSLDEKMNLVNLCDKYKQFIECKKTDSVSWKQKDDTWEKIAIEFNSNSSCNVYRDKDSLKKCFDNQKKSTRKSYALNRQEMYKTGGGNNVAPAISFIDQAVSSVITSSTIHGHSNTYDGDRYMEPPISLENGYCIEESQQEMEDWSSGNVTGSSLTKKSNSKLHTPKSDKKQWTARRRPILSPTGNVARKYEEVAAIKLKVAEAYFATIQAKENREKEEFSLRKELLLLEIELKKKELNSNN